MDSNQLKNVSLDIALIKMQRKWDRNSDPISQFALMYASLSFLMLSFGLVNASGQATFPLLAILIAFIISESYFGYEYFVDALIAMKAVKKKAIPISVRFRIVIEDESANMCQIMAWYCLDKVVRGQIDRGLKAALVEANENPKIISDPIDFHTHLIDWKEGELEVCVFPAGK